MKNVEDLISSAAELAEHGRSKGEIADELNVSRKTAAWLVKRSEGIANEGEPDEDSSPHDIHVDWSVLGRDTTRLGYMGAAMAHLVSNEPIEVDLVVGVENAGVPLATMVASELGADLSTYSPRKHQWEEGDIDDLGGSFSRNFANLRDRDCYIIDDTITSGTTMQETIEAVQNAGGNPLACAVLVDKRGIEEIRDVPILSLMHVIRVGNDE